MICPTCEFENRDGDQFCVDCGSLLAIELGQRCRSCGSSLPAKAKFCPECGSEVGTRDQVIEEPSTRPASAIGERKPVTILFADIVGSTAIAEALDPEEWREVVEGAHRRVTEAVTRYGGTIAQLLGDGVLAFFGAPVTHEDDPDRAVRAAIDLQSAIGVYADELIGYVDNFAMRVGIHAGIVVVGELGSDEHSEYLAVGDAVNIAARLEGMAEPGQIILSEQIAHRIGFEYELEDLGLKDLKGKQERLRVFSVHGTRKEPGANRGLVSLERVFVGRESELEMLQSALLELCQGHGQVRMILGEAGIGKSRLIEELRRNLPDEPGSREQYLVKPSDVRWLEARAVSYGESLSFWLITQLILEDLGLSDGAPAPKLRATLSKRLVQLVGDRQDDLLPLISRLLGIELKPEHQQRISGYDAETLRYETFRAVEVYLERVVEQAPVILVLEDLHWADASSLEMLERLLALTDRGPLLILGLMRPERDSGSWDFMMKAAKDYGHRYAETHLEPLAGEDVQKVFERVFEEGQYSDEVMNLLLGKAEGNPFYLEELIRHLIERDLIKCERGTWIVANELDEVGIPETLQGLVLARIDRLEEGVQKTLQLAAVIGRTFLFSLLATLSEAERALQDHISMLQRADLVREKARLPELEYIFKHAITQEAAYSSLLLERRRQFHRRVAQAVEDLFADRIEEFYGLLAHHYDAAGESEQAVEYLGKAADKARIQGSLVEAKSLLKRLLDLHKQGGNKALEARTWLKLALVYQTDFEFGEAHRAYEMAFSTSREIHSGDIEQFSSEDSEAVLRIPVYRSQLEGLVFDDVRTHLDTMVRSDLQAGLLQIDHELNLIPNAARSWEVLDDGRRYLFHLRDDVRWSDGSRVVAQDYVRYLFWLLERNLESPFLDDVEGVYAFRKGELAQIDDVGIHALTEQTIEMRLTHPASYFLYRIAINGFPLPPSFSDNEEDDYWLSESSLFSGPFILESADSDEMTQIRNPHFFGEWQGNLTGIRTIGFDHSDDWKESYLENELDACWHPAFDELDDPLAHGNLISTPRILTCQLIYLNPNLPPTNRLDFRKAIAHAISRETRAGTSDDLFYPAYGGVVLPGMPGHSPEIGIEENQEMALNLLEQLRQDPDFDTQSLSGIRPRGADDAEEDIQAWLESVGLTIDFSLRPGLRRIGDISTNLYAGGWVADFPDPHNMLVDMMVTVYSTLGWQHEGLNEFINKLMQVNDRRSRMDIVRQFDRYLVQEQVLVVPAYYGGFEKYLIKPWVKNYTFNALNQSDSTRIVIHTAQRDEQSLDSA